MSTIAIRTAGGSGYGAGHIQRMGVLASALVRVYPNIAVEFWVEGPPEVAGWLAESSFHCHYLGENVDLAQESEWIAQSGAVLFIIDLLHVADERLAIFTASSGSTVLFSDMGNSDRSCDLLIQPQNLTLRGKVGSNALIGPDYFVMNSMYADAWNRKRNIPKTAQRLLVSMGGEGNSRALLRLGKVVGSLEPMWDRITWILGRCSDDVASTLRVSLPNVRIFGFVEDMCKRLMQVDLAIVAGGFVKYEAACCGTPALILAQYEHQRKLGREFAATGAARYLGFVDDLAADEIVEQVARLQGSREERLEISQAGKRLVDGRGLERVVSRIKQYLL